MRRDVWIPFVIATFTAGVEVVGIWFVNVVVNLPPLW